MSSLYIAKEKSKSRHVLHLGKNLQSLAREGEVNATCLKPVSPPGDYIFNPSVFSHLRQCKCFCYTCHLHFYNRNVDPCFCSSFSCTHLLQPEQFILFTRATFSFLLILDHFLDVLCRLVRNTMSCGRGIFSDIREKTIAHNTSLQKKKKYKYLRSPNAIELSATDTVFRKFKRDAGVILWRNSKCLI